MDRIKKMNLEEVQQRKAAISVMLGSGEECDLDALTTEVDALNARESEIAKNVEKRNALVENVIANGIVIPKKEVVVTDSEKRNFGIDSVEYRDAFLKNLQGLELNDLEKRAFTHTTANTKAVLPAELQNKIYSNMEEQHPILRDVNILRSGVSISIVKHTEIVAGDAKVVGEGSANDDEQNTFVNVTLTGVKFSKHVDFTYELESMALPAFQKYLTDEISSRLGSAMAKYIIDSIRTGVATANKFAAKNPGTLSLEDIMKGFGLLKSAPKTFVYTNTSTLFNNIALMKGKEGLIGFIPNHAESISGQLLGKGIKEEDALPDGEVLILDPKQYMFNVVKDITLETDRDIKKGVNTIAGHAIAGGSLTNDKAGVFITVGTAI